LNAKGRRAGDYVADIRQAIERIQTYASGADFSAFSMSEMMRDAIVHNFEIIGEAAKCLTRDCPSLVALHPEVPWKAMSEMRNFLAHRYFLIDLVVVWNTMKRDLPVLDRQMQHMLQELDGRLA
jgi:uncharacterized protein with HEPN domain